jgi:hypothetical protein
VLRQAIQIPVGAFLIVALLALASASAQPPEPKKDKPEQKTAPEVDEQHRREAEKVVGEIALEMRVDGEWSRVKRIEKPLLYFGDPTRENDRGSLWGWGEKDRPVALLEIYQNATDRTKWVYAICNTSGGKVRAAYGGKAWWRENESASELKDVPGAAAPASEGPQRQKQLKQLAQKFTGHQFWDPNNSRYELRRLERPLCTYRDEDSGILEGALYTLANGTNPEIMLFIEARVDPKDKSRTAWQYAVGRLAHAELHMDYDGKEVFNAPRGDKLSASDKPYWLDFIKSSTEPKDK